MKTLRCFVLLLLTVLPGLLYAGDGGGAAPNGMVAKQRNYRTFREDVRHLPDEAKKANARTPNHPEIGRLFADAPCADCYEVIAERTEKSKKFVMEGTGGKEVALQTSTDAMHYRDAEGNWRTIEVGLHPYDHNIYGAFNQPEPVSINTRRKGVEISHPKGWLRFNYKLELVYRDAAGAEQSLGQANWSKATIGTDGMYVTDIWPGIDMEVYVGRGWAKTNFNVKHAMPAYSGGQLLIRDHVEMADGLRLVSGDTTDVRDNLQVTNANGEALYNIGAATVYEEQRPEQTLQFIGYDVHATSLDIVVPGSVFDRPASSYPVVIDPLVSTTTASTVGGSSYSPTKTISCNYLNAATVPAAVTVTDVRWTFNYTASGGAFLLHGAVDFTLGSCRSPGAGGFFWYCNLASGGTCTGTNVSIISDIGPCVLPPQCLSYNMNLNMRFYQNFAATTPCATTYITAATPLTVTVFGRTVETSAISSGGGLTAVCLGQSVSLSTTPSFGVPPYTYLWDPGSVAGSPLVATPASTTVYTVTVSDACSNTAQATQMITVTPISANTGNAVVCVGGTTTLSNPSGTGTWSSSAGAVAVVGPATGIVTGISPGTAVITFTNTLGCYATTVVTVVPMPGSITGTATVCVGNTTTLSNPLAAGTWTSGATAIATVGAGSGVVTGVAAGTATITYTTTGGCTATKVVTVYPNPVITSVAFTNPTTCGAADGTITISGLGAGVIYTVGYLHNSVPVTLTDTANSGGVIVLAGLSAGVYAGIQVKSPDGCTGTWAGTVTLTDMGTPPIPTAGSNSPVCEGWILKLTATSAPGVTYNWTGPGGFTSTLQNPQIDPATPANAGVYSVTASLLSCTTLPATVTVTVNALPHISNVKSSNPITCGGSEGTIILEGLSPGVAYTIGLTYNGVPATYTATADAVGNVTLYGRPSGTYTGIFVQTSLCASNVVGPVVLTDPAAPPPPVITSNAPICVGGTLLLFGADDKPDGTYKWEGPNGFYSTEQNPTIEGVTAGAQGVYTLTYTRWNCSSSTTAEIKLQPVIELSDIKANKYVLNYGDSVQLHVEGASYYNWTPRNGTMSNYYIPDPFVKPRDSVNEYVVRGMNEWGCYDSASVVIRVIFDEEEYLPNAFTPNGDGKNDVFRIGKMKYKKVVQFTIYNRWGQEVYNNPWDPNGGWDGTYNGKEQDMGVYFYSIIIESASGKLRYYKGDVTLIR